jgi:acyl dehydratase
VDRKVDLTYGRINDEELKRLKSRIGVEFRDNRPWVTLISSDAIRHWAHGIGDDNPLWLDEEYARKTSYGGIIAPPTILYACDRVASGYVGGLPGVQAMYSGTNWKWFRVLRENDRIKGISMLKDLVHKKSEFAGEAIQQIYETTFIDQKGEKVGQAESWCFRTERDVAAGRGKYLKKVTEMKKWSQEELAEIWGHYKKEVENRRGSNPRYWEEVKVGEEVFPLVKGPFMPMSGIAFVQGWGGFYIHGERIAWEEYIVRHPGMGPPDELGLPQGPIRVHWDNEFARRVGVPGAYDYGPQRVSWLGHLLTDWMGDDGFLRTLNARVTRFNISGDVQFVKGKVLEKTREGKNAVVKIEVWAENQRGEISAKGDAEVLLPSKGKSKGK